MTGFNEKSKLKGGGGGTPAPVVKEIPDGYEYKKGANGKLQLWQGSTMIAEQDQFGAWLATSVQTGTGSLHIGDLHSNGSGGENVVWVNTDSQQAYFPSWASVSVDGSSAGDMTARTHGALTTSEPVGAVHASIAVDYNTTFTAPLSVAFFAIDVVPTENYTGKLQWIATKSTNKEVAAFFFDVVAVAGQTLKVQFKYPLWVVDSQTFTVELKKADGSYLKCRAGLTDTTKPYRKTYYRTFSDSTVWHYANTNLLKDVMGIDTTKSLFFVSDLVGSNHPVPFAANLTGSATSTVRSIDDGRLGVWEQVSSSISGSSSFVGMASSHCMPEMLGTFTVYFKTPPVMDSQLQLQFGYTAGTTTGDRVAIEMTGTTAQAKVVIGGTTTLNGSTFTVAADTWYIGRMICLAANSVKLQLYSATGTLLNETTLTGTFPSLTSSPASIRGINSNTTVRTMFKVDRMELYIPIPSGRYFLPL